MQENQRVKPTRQDLSSLELRQQLKSLQGPQTSRFLTAVMFDYGVIALCITLSLVTLHYSLLTFVLLLPLALLIIACRQHALLVLMHDATHYLAHNNRFVNDLLGDLLCGAPMGVKLATYRRDHLAHHQHTNSDADPDWVRKLGTAAEAKYWKFPLTEPLWRFLGKSWGGSIAYLLRSFSHLSASTEERTTASSATNPISRYRNLLYLVLLIALVTTSSIGWFLLFWVAPLLLVLPMIMRLRSIAEHFALPNEHEFNATRNVKAGWVERFLLAPHYVGLHLDHHLVASVPWHRLPELSELLSTQPTYAQYTEDNDGYFVGSRSLINDMRGTSLLAPPALGVTTSQSPA